MTEKKITTVKEALAAVKKNEWALKDLPEELRTEEVCIWAMKRYMKSFFVKDDLGPLFQFVPENLRTAELCLEAVKDDRRALQFIPEKLKTAEICFAAVKERDWFYDLLFYENVPAFKYVPENIKTAELCLEASGKE